MKKPKHKILRGDWGQIKALSELWQIAFHEKEIFISKAASVKMTQEQRVAADLHLVMITANMKTIDAKIHYLMFGGDLTPQVEAMPLIWQVQESSKRQESVVTKEPDITKQEAITYKEKRLLYLEDRRNKEFRLRCTLQQENWKLKKQLKNTVANVLVGIPGPLTITVPEERF
jgi:hypothetical protein